jgi:signal transduction histidine kinase
VPEPVVARVDPVRFGQLLDNLLSNAVKFTPAGGSVRVSLHEEDGRAMLVVSDTGVGIPKDEQSGVFDRFYRTRAATEGAVPGTGLGLAITRAIAEAHGATISLESELGSGTEVTVAFGRR